MRTYRELTDRGRARRLRALAGDAVVEALGVEPGTLRLRARHSFNTVFRVEPGPVALRVGSGVRIHHPGVEDVEAAWLDALADAGLTSLRNRRTLDGRRWLTIGTTGVPEPRVCTLFEWVPGRPLDRRPTPDRLEAAGRLLARLHDHAATEPTAIPERLRAPLRADRAIGFAVADRVSDHRSVDGRVFVEAIERVQAAIDELWRSPPHRPHLLHGDFGPNNVLAVGRRLDPIDFQDLQLGFDLQDVATAVDSLARRRPELVEPFRRGYRSVRPWPDLPPELAGALAAGRHLTIMNLALVAPERGIGTALQPRAEAVVAWMTGAGSDRAARSRRPSAPGGSPGAP